MTSIFIATMTFILLLVALQLWQWSCVLFNLYIGEYVTKKDFLLRMLPGYFVIAFIRITWDIFSKYMMLKSGNDNGTRRLKLENYEFSKRKGEK